MNRKELSEVVAEAAAVTQRAAARTETARAGVEEARKRQEAATARLEEISSHWAERDEKQDAMLEKQDAMLERQDATLERQDATLAEMKAATAAMRVRAEEDHVWRWEYLRRQEKMFQDFFKRADAAVVEGRESTEKILARIDDLREDSRAMQKAILKLIDRLPPPPPHLRSA